VKAGAHARYVPAGRWHAFAHHWSHPAQGRASIRMWGLRVTSVWAWTVGVPAQAAGQAWYEAGGSARPRVVCQQLLPCFLLSTRIKPFKGTCTNVPMRYPACNADGTDTVLWKYALEEHFSDQHRGQEAPAVFVLCEKEKKAMLKGMQGKQKRSTRR
jgi:hypothetical protein